MKHSKGLRAARLSAALAAAAAMLGGAGALAQPHPACDRACLTGFVGRYLGALAAHEPGRLAVTANVRFTEDGAPLKLGDGLWRTNQGLGPYRLDFADPASGQTGALVTVKENGNLALMALRLRIRGGRIAEVETVLARKGELQSLQTDLLQQPLPILLEDIPEGRKSSRAELERIANSYFDAIEKADGSIAPFADDGFRIENGVRTCNNPVPTTGGASPDFARLRGMKCADQLSTKIFTYIQSVRPRRFVVDDQKGLVLAEVRFNHPGDVPYVDTPGYGRVSMAQNPWAVRPTSALISELFRVEDHKIQRVMAVITNVPYRMPTGWENGSR
jgi:hypothetical protein